jgi:hypothetical protein
MQQKADKIRSSMVLSGSIRHKIADLSKKTSLAQAADASPEKSHAGKKVAKFTA